MPICPTCGFLMSELDRGCQRCRYNRINNPYPVRITREPEIEIELEPIVQPPIEAHANDPLIAYIEEQKRKWRIFTNTIIIIGVIIATLWGLDWVSKAPSREMEKTIRELDARIPSQHHLHFEPF